MTIARYRKDLRAAKRELADLANKRQQIDGRIAHLQPLITHLEGLCGVLDQNAAAKKAAQALTAGLTDSIREVLRRGLIPMNAAEVRRRMVEGKFDFSKYSNPLASIHTVLKRLAKSGEVQVVPLKDGRKTYAWMTEIQRALKAFVQTSPGFKVSGGTVPKVPQ